MEDSQKPYQLQKITDVFESYGVSAHYIIDRQGQIYRLVEESRVAYHAGKGQLPHPPFHKDDLNSRSIGIEIMAIGSAKDMKGYMNAEKYSQIPAEHIGYTDAQYKALNWLIQDISTRNQGIVRNRKHIIGHDEYAPERKNDPGELFDWNRLEGIK
jgi:N-acetyl-anhydromuramyl-L-alanine amidase AmpD